MVSWVTRLILRNCQLDLTEILPHRRRHYPQI